MNRAIILLALAGCLGLAWPHPAAAKTRLETGKVETSLAPGPVEYAVLLPPGYDKAGKPLPLVIALHGGAGDSSLLSTLYQPILSRLWESGELIPMVVAMPSAGRSFYMDFGDGSQRWESFIMGPFLEHLRKTLNVGKTRWQTLITGGSMGGLGALRLAFKHPEAFAAVAALNPAIEPVYTWDQLKPKNTFWRPQALFNKIFGQPVDKDFWNANNPAFIARRDAEGIRASHLAIYFEAGDRDQFWLYEGAEFLHRALWEARIRHEYHLILGADHGPLGREERTREIFAFLNRALKPWEAANNPRRAAVMKRLEGLKERLPEKDHYHPY